MNMGRKREGVSYTCLYIALESWNLLWPVEHIEKAMDLWMNGIPITTIAAELSADVDELALLIIDLSSTYKYFFPARDNGVNLSTKIGWTVSQKKSLGLFLLKNKPVYEVCANYDMFWEDKDVHKVEEYWREDVEFEKICKKVKRDSFEVMVLLLDRLKLGHIEPRKEGIEGNWMTNEAKTSSRKKAKSAS